MLHRAYISSWTQCGILLTRTVEKAFWGVGQIDTLLGSTKENPSFYFMDLRDVLNELAGGILVYCRSWKEGHLCMADILVGCG